ncbi:MAG: efflux RND transporter periplasmic adaptor subunit [Owenweeksia sp.]
MNKTLKYVLFIGVPLIILLIIAKSQGWVGTKEGLEVETGKVKTTSILESVVASGKIQPEVEVKISSEVSGEIIQLPVEEGQKVKKGDLLVKINPDIYLAAVNRSQATVNSSRSAVSTAKAQLIEAEKIFNRNQKLYNQKVISDSEFEAIQRAYEVSKLNVESAQYQLQSALATANEARDNLSRTTIYAPQAGTISMLNAEVGERVVGTAQMTGTEIMRIANLENMEVLVEVNENDIIRVSESDTAIIEVDAYLGREFKGVVTEIANSAKIEGFSTDQVTNFEVKVRILKESYQSVVKDSSRSPFRPGMTASVEIQTERRNGILSVPIESVTTRTDTSTSARSYKIGREDNEDDKDNDEEYEVVFIYKDDKAVLQVVKTGIQDDEFIEITSGLEEGQEVITGPYSTVTKKLVNGERVKRKTSSDRRKKNGEERD